ncbi:MAG: hypothetical protein IS632_04925 [Thaumarchaeota archaeon]|nr:hypothetical protein [Nitrososphaerota archaeon]
MRPYDAILLNIRASGESAVGRTVLQKLIYLQSSLGIKIEATYIPHYYGPYSKDVAIALADLVAFDYVDEKRSREALGYAYTLTHDGEGIADDAEKENKEQFEKIEEIVSKCRNCLMPGPMSYAAKVHYILSVDPTFRPEDVADMFGWKMDDRKVHTGQELLKRLGLDKHKRV